MDIEYIPKLVSVLFKMFGSQTGGSRAAQYKVEHTSCAQQNQT